MPAFVILGLIIWGVVTLAGMFFRWLLGLSALTLILFLVVVAISDKMNAYLLGRPFHGEISMTGYNIRGPYDPRLGDRAGWLSLTIKNTDNRDYPVNMAVCSIRGPIYYDPAYGHDWTTGRPIGAFVAKEVADASGNADKWYLGERRMIVRLVAVASTKAAQGWGMDSPVAPVADRTFFWNAPESVRTIAYYVAFQKLRLFEDDTVEWCKFGRTVADLPQEASEPRVEWVGQHVNLPIDHVVLDASAVALP